MIQVGIIGSSGYVAGELIRVLVHHPEVTLSFLYSHSHAGKPVSSVHDDLFSFGELKFTDKTDPNVDVIFLCLGHGNSSRFLQENAFNEKTVIIDLSNDFRLFQNSVLNDRKFIYGLPELQKDKIKTSRSIANPGCFATAIQLGLLPFAEENKLHSEIHVQAITGATGAGKSLSDTSHFSWRNNNVSAYKVFNHQHLAEIKESVKSLQLSFEKEINFVPIRGDFTRGIFASIYFDSELNAEEILRLFSEYYKDSPFVAINSETIHLKQVVNTNHALIQVQKIETKVHVTVIIDNLLKGASGQAVQNMNLIFNLPETTGLNLKPNYF